MMRLWHRLRWVDRLRLAALGLMLVTSLVASLMVNVFISQEELSNFARDEKSTYARLVGIGSYLDGLSAAVLPALIRRDPGELVDALNRAQGDRYAGIEPRFVILALPDGTILASSDARRFPVQSVVPDDLRRRFPAAENGLGSAVNQAAFEPGTDRVWLVRTLRTDGFRAGRLFAEVDIPGLERGKSRLRWSLAIGWVIGCLMTLLVPLGVILGVYFVLKRTLPRWIAPLEQLFFNQEGTANQPFLVAPHHGTAGRIAEIAMWIAMWIVTALFLITFFYL